MTSCPSGCHLDTRLANCGGSETKWPSGNVSISDQMLMSSGDRGTHLTLDHRHFHVIAVNALECVLLEMQRRQRNVDKQHQGLALGACSTFNFRGSDKRLKW
jgi:hypothetical protein